MDIYAVLYCICYTVCIGAGHRAEVGKHTGTPKWEGLLASQAKTEKIHKRAGPGFETAPIARQHWSAKQELFTT